MKLRLYLWRVHAKAKNVPIETEILGEREPGARESAARRGAKATTNETSTRERGSTRSGCLSFNLAASV